MAVTHRNSIAIVDQGIPPSKVADQDYISSQTHAQFHCNCWVWIEWHLFTQLLNIITSSQKGPSWFSNQLVQEDVSSARDAYLNTDSNSATEEVVLYTPRC